MGMGISVFLLHCLPLWSSLVWVSTMSVTIILFTSSHSCVLKSIGSTLALTEYGPEKCIRSVGYQELINAAITACREKGQLKKKIPPWP